MSVVIETTLGDITVDLYLKERPNACLNFLKLCKIKYYNLCLFYKIERNFIAQTGDPTGTGRGGESVFSHLYGDQAKYFDSEFKPRLKHDKLGTISMVNNGNNMNGSQFFLTLGENITYLDEVHTVFGEVVEGSDVLLKLNEAICDGNNRPYQDIRITHTVILHDPYEDPKGLEIPDASPEPTKEQLESGYIAADEEIDDNKGKSAEEIEEKIKESEAKARATILEMVGDIPDADVKPPENVLFVCKLNPVTTSEDLEVIFSRFGSIVSCEVIKDKKTGESLQYAFIEFEKEEDCENAYFKMDNVLIDDRRIHVDFSQSVSKLNWEKDGKFSHNKSSKQNVVLKTNQKGTDGYDLIFDMNDADQKEINKDNKGQKHRHQTLEDKHLYSKYKKSDTKRHRSRSPTVKERKHENEKRYSRDSQRYTDTKSDGNYRGKSSKYEHSSYQKNRSRDYDQPAKESSRHLSERTSKNYRNSDKSRKSSERYSSKYSDTSRNKRRYDSVSPDRKRRKSYDKQRCRSSSYKESSKSKHSDKFDHHATAESKRDKKCKSSHRDSKRSGVSHSPQVVKFPFEKKSFNSKKLKKSRKMSRSSSSSSSSSSSVAERRPKKSNRSSSSSSSSSSVVEKLPKKSNRSSSESDSSSSDSSDERRKKKKMKFSNKKLSENASLGKQKKKKCKYSS